MTDVNRIPPSLQQQEEEKLKKIKTNEENRKLTRGAKEAATNSKLEDYMQVIYSATTTTSINNYINADVKQENKAKKTKSSNSKSVAPNETNENRFIIKQLIEKCDPDTGKRVNLNVLSDMIKDEEDEETSYKMKKDILLSKLMCDKSIINDKTFANSFVDNVITLIYLSLSPESRKLILDKNSQTESNTFFHHLIGFNQENFLKNPVITNETILYLCNNILKNEDLFQSQNEETEEKQSETIVQETVVQEVPDLYNKLIFEEEVVAEHPKEKVVQIRNESHLEITKNDDSKMNDSGLNALIEMIKNSQNKSITEKVESLIQVFSKNEINNKKINLDNKIKNELLMRLREEFLREKEVIDEEAKQNKLNKSKQSNNSKFNPKNSNMTSEIEINITNPFTKNVADVSGTPNETNVGFAQKGWGVNSNLKSKGNTKTSSVDKIESKREFRKENVVVKKHKNTKTPVKKTNMFREDEKGYENNFWLGDQINDEDDDSDEWMVIK